MGLTTGFYVGYPAIVLKRRRNTERANEEGFGRDILRCLARLHASTFNHIFTN